MTVVAAETPELAGEGLEATGAMPDALKRELGERDEAGSSAPAGGLPGARDVIEGTEKPGDAAGIPAEQAAFAPEPMRAPAELEMPAPEKPLPPEQAAEQLAAAVTAALRPDAAPLDYAPCRRDVGAAVERLQGALLGLIHELEPRVGTTVADSAVARAQHLAADIRFVRPVEVSSP